MINPRKLLALALPLVATLAIAFLAGCDSNIQPLKPLMRVELWVPADGSAPIELSPPTPIPAPTPALAPAPATQSSEPRKEFIPIDAATQPSATQAATQPSGAQTAASEPAITAATQSATAPALAATGPAATLPANLPPGEKFVKIIDPNETGRFVYKATYSNIWQQALSLASQMGFELDRRDYRLGVITTLPLASSQIIEFWKPQQTTAKNALENTINSQRRSLRITINPVPGKPDFYQIAVQVLVERETNPSEALTNPVVFVEGSGFGRSSIALRSDYSSLAPEPERWAIIGHDVQLERKLLDQIFQRI